MDRSSIRLWMIAEMFTPEAEDDYIFCGGRINSCKRQHLLVQAMRSRPVHVRLLIAGPPDTQADGQQSD